MAKDKDVKATNGDANKAGAEAVVEEKKKLSADEKKKLFEAYDKVETKFVELEKQRERPSPIAWLPSRQSTTASARGPSTGRVTS